MKNEKFFPCPGGETVDSPPHQCRCGEIGIHAAFRALWAQAHVGSNPTIGIGVGASVAFRALWA